MASTYTLNNGIELIGTGEQSGTWGDTTNTNFDLVDTALDGQVSILLAGAGSSGSPNNLPVSDGSASNGRNRMITFTDGTDLGATAYVQLTPNDSEKIIYVRNSLSGSRSIILFQGTYNASNDYEVPAGTTAVVYFDGAGSGAVAANVFNNAHFDALNIVGSVTVGGGVTVTGTVDAGTVEFDNLSGTGAVSVTNILDEDNMASDSATALSTQQSIKAYVDAQVGSFDTLAEVLAQGNTTGGTDIAVSTGDDITFADSSKAIFGDDNDLQIYHDGSNSYIKDVGTGNLIIAGDADIQITDSVVGENKAVFSSNGAVTLYYDNASKFATTSTGIDVTGTVTATTLQTNAGGTVTTAAGNDLNIVYPDGRSLFFKEAGTTTLTLDNAQGATFAGTALVTGVLTTTAATVFNGGFVSNANSGIGATPTTWSLGKTLNIGAPENYIWGESGNNLHIGNNAYYNSGYKYVSTDEASSYTQNNGTHAWFTAASGSADAALTWTQTLYIDASGNIIIPNTGGTLRTTTAGTSNFRAGVNAGNSIASGGDYNVCVGDEAGTAISTGDQNTAVGYQALATENANSNNTAIGYQALKDQDGGDGNTAVGSFALQDLTNASRSTAVGSYAGFSSQGADDVTFIGHNAGLYATTAEDSVFVGSQAGQGITGAKLTGNDNTAIGASAGLLLQGAATQNTFVGKGSGQAVTVGVKNTLLGSRSGDALINADSNVAIGESALSSDTYGDGSVAIGDSALYAQNFTSAATSFNTAVGYAAGNSTTTGQSNVFVGHSSGKFNSTGYANTFVGSAAGTGVTGTPITGSNNTAVGQDSGNNLRGAAHSNSFLGQGSGANVTTGSENTYIGFEAGDATQTAISNTAVGYRALSGTANTGNTAIGRNSLIATTGSSNTGLGKDSGLEIVGGSNNMCLGHDSGRSSSPGGSITTGSNTITLGDNNIATANIKVDWTVSSDQRDKTDFAALDIGLDFVKALNPVTYKWDERSNYGDHTEDDWSLSDQTPDGTYKKDWLDIGFKAQEVEALEQAAGYNKSNKTNLTVSLSPDGEQYGMKYSKFIPILVKAIQEQNALIEALTARIATLEG